MKKQGKKLQNTTIMFTKDPISMFHTNSSKNGCESIRITMEDFFSEEKTMVVMRFYMGLVLLAIHVVEFRRIRSLKENLTVSRMFYIQTHHGRQL